MLKLKNKLMFSIPIILLLQEIPPKYKLPLRVTFSSTINLKELLEICIRSFVPLSIIVIPPWHETKDLMSLTVWSQEKTKSHSIINV